MNKMQDRYFIFYAAILPLSIAPALFIWLFTLNIRTKPSQVFLEVCATVFPYLLSFHLQRDCFIQSVSKIELFQKIFFKNFYTKHNKQFKFQFLKEIILKVIYILYNILCI